VVPLLGRLLLWVVLMAGLPKIGAPPYPSNFGAVKEYMRDKVEPFIEGKAWIHIVDPTTQTVVRDWEAGTSEVTIIPIWSGWARVQPIRNTVNSWRATNPTTTRVVQFWVEFPDDIVIDLQKAGLRIAIENLPDDDNNDPWLAEYQYVILGGLNSSQAWQRTIDTQVDLENRPNYDMSAWPKPPED
jgi:hypothetical protein